MTDVDQDQGSQTLKRDGMRIEMKGLFAALAAGLFVVGASYGVSALVAPHAPKHPMRIMPMDAMPMKDMGMDHGGTKGSGGMKGSGTQNQGAVQADLVREGRTLYGAACSSCHGAGAQGAFGPSLYSLGLPDAQVAAVIRNGVKGKMPAYGGKYDAPHIQALVAYVQSLKK